MDKVIIYFKPTCPYCIKAKALLDSKQVKYKEIDVSNDDNLYNEMISKAGGKTSVPQIFINDVHIGGCDDLHKLDSEGKLDALLSKH